jgi:two-component SAPR family response regulator
VYVDGKALNNSDWQTQSVRDLFFFFLTQPRPLTKEQVSAMLWPEIDAPAKLRLRFKNELYRLRRAVGQEVILFENLVYSFNRNLDYEYDVEAFESFLAKAATAKTAEEQISFYQRAVDMVKGPYLDDIYFEWTLVDRERLNHKYLDALLILADLYQKQAQLDEALATCRRAIKRDPTSEAAYRLCMQIYQRLGDRQAILRTYQAFASDLKQNVGLNPSPEMKDFYQKLLR